MTTRICSGRGDCLTQNCDPSVPDLYVKYRDVTCEHNCEPVKCPNFAMCGEIGPKWYFGCHGGRCFHCNMFFGKNLTFPEEPQECPICIDISPCVQQPNCSHAVCIACFRRTRYDGPPREEQPPFPYPDREDEYDSLSPPAELLNDPLVIAWNDQLNLQDDMRSIRYEEEANLRKCPLCRS